MQFDLNFQDTFDRIQQEKEIVMNRNCYFGAKVVRGAYLERERYLAAENGYEDPVHPTYEATGQMYNQVINHMIVYVCITLTIYMYIYIRYNINHKALHFVKFSINKTSNTATHWVIV